MESIDGEGNNIDISRQIVDKDQNILPSVEILKNQLITSVINLLL